MSIAQIDRVWNHSASKGTERLVLLAIADCANDQGLAWPSLETIARKAAVHRSTVVRLERKLEKRGELRVERSRGRTSNRYHVTIQPSHIIQPSQNATVANGNGRTSPLQPSHPAHPTVARDATGTVSEPSKNRERGRRRLPATPLPEEFPLSERMQKFAMAGGLRDAGMVFGAFKDWHRAQGTLMHDWEAGWRTWCRKERQYRTERSQHLRR